MKIELLFESLEEFAGFVVSASFLEFDTGRTTESQLKKSRRLLSTEAYWPLLSHVYRVRVGDIVYSVNEDSGEAQCVDCEISNYIVNDVQIGNDTIWMRTDDGGKVYGAGRVFEQIKKLPYSFLLRVGWRTDYQSYVFRKLSHLGGSCAT